LKYGLFSSRAERIKRTKRTESSLAVAQKGAQAPPSPAPAVRNPFAGEPRSRQPGAVAAAVFLIWCAFAVAIVGVIVIALVTPLLGGAL
jgi:hypothetical protein